VTPKASAAEKSTPVVKITPAPKISPAPKVSPTPKVSAVPRIPLKGGYKPTPSAVEPKATPVKSTPPPEATPAKEEDTGDKNQGMTSDVPFVPTQTSPASTPAETPKPVSLEEQEAKDKARYHEIKAKALEDSDLKALKEKADNATGDDERTAERAYNKALFKKLREIDPSISDYLDRMEKATMKRLGGEDDNASQ
jgi:hypothetical protein